MQQGNKKIFQASNFFKTCHFFNNKSFDLVKVFQLKNKLNSK